MMIVFNMVVDAIVGAVFGVVASRYLFVGRWYSLLIWAIVGLILSHFGKSKKDATLQGSVFGFFLFFAFIVAGYNGSHPLVTRLPFFMLIGILGIVFGLIIFCVGFYLRKLIRSNHKTHG